MIDLLNKILSDKINRVAYIQAFQNLIWHGESNSELLSVLAFDLDFYEPNEEVRKEDISYFGDDKLEELISEVIQKLEML